MFLIIEPVCFTHLYFTEKTYAFSPVKPTGFLRVINLIFRYINSRTGSQLVYIPKWHIEFSSGDYSYEREILAHSGKIMTDPISICPNHLFKDFIRTSKKNTVAVCEVCGNAFCDKHVFKCSICVKWICEKHSVVCATCGQHVCPEHIVKYCEICNKPICNNCNSICPICHKMYCKDHMVECTKCHNIVCKNCVTPSRKKLIFKKYTCRNCE